MWQKSVWTEFVSEIIRSEFGRCYDKSFPTCYACPAAIKARFNRSWPVFKVKPLFFFGVYNICKGTEQRVCMEFYQIIGNGASETYQLTWTILGDTTIDGQRGFRRLRTTSRNVPTVFIVRLSVCPQELTRLSRHGLSWYMILEVSNPIHINTTPEPNTFVYYFIRRFGCPFDHHQQKI